MSIDSVNDLLGINSKIDAYKTTIVTKRTEKQLKKLSDSGNNLEEKKTEVLKQLNDIESNIQDSTQRLKSEVKNQYDELINLFKLSVTDKIGDINNIGGGTKKSKSVDFLLTQVLEAAKNTKSRISEIFIEETMSVAGCSQEQTFLGNVDSNGPNKVYIRLNQIDLFNLLKNNPNEGNNDLLYEVNNPFNGETPFSMDRELYNRTQNEGVSFSDDYGSDYIGGSGLGIMNMKYVTSYTQNGVNYIGDFLEITLKDRPNGNRISDFLRDYYSSINIIDFDALSVKLTNVLTNFMDISVGISSSDKQEKSKFQKIIQRILGLCFDNTKEIDVSGTAKLSAMDSLDQSFFEVDGFELRNIENEIENLIKGVTEFEDCGNVKLPVNTDFISDSLRNIRYLPDSKKVEAVSTMAEEMAKDENWKNSVDPSINLDVAIKTDLLKAIPMSVVTTILSPKGLLGLMVVLKSLESTVINQIEDFETFKNNMKKFMVNLVSRIGSIFVEELFKLLKRNLRLLVQTLIIDIIKESKNAKIKMITSILFLLIQIASAVVDWRQCKSVIDEILNLLSLSAVLNLGNRMPNYALAGSMLLPGFSSTRAMTNVTENLQKLGLPTGDMPDGSPNLMLPAIFQQIKGVNDEQLENSKTETWCAPVPVGLVVTSYIRCSGKNY